MCFLATFSKLKQLVEDEITWATADQTEDEKKREAGRIRQIFDYFFGNISIIGISERVKVSTFVFSALDVSVEASIFVAVVAAFNFNLWWF